MKQNVTWFGCMPSTTNRSCILDEVDVMAELCKTEQWHCMFSSDSLVTFKIIKGLLSKSCSWIKITMINNQKTAIVSPR